MCAATYISDRWTRQEEAAAPEDEEAPAADTKDHELVRAAALEAMVAASVKQQSVPASQNSHIVAPDGWTRCNEALAGVELMLHDCPAAADADATDQVIISACDVDKLDASGAKQTVDELLARHAKRVFPQLPATLTADPSLVLLLLDAPNILTTMALVKTFPELRAGGFAARVCIPQCDPDHYARMVTQVCSLIFNPP